MLCVAFFTGKSVAAPPANDLIENAAALPGFVGAVSNLSNIDATASVTDPEYSATSVNIWFKPPPTTIATTGTVSVAGVGGFLPSIRVYELRTNGYFRTSFPTSSVIITNTPGKTNLIGVFFNKTPVTNLFTLSYSFPTLQQTLPAASANLKAPGAVEIAFTNREPGVEFQSVKVFARNTGIWTNVIGESAMLPFQFTWTNVAAGFVDFFAEAVTTSGELRRSTTNRFSFRNLNDDFASAVDLNPEGGATEFRPNGLTRESGEPAGPNQGSLWYRWVPARTGAAQFAITPATPLLLYTGSSLTSLTLQPLLPTVEGASAIQAEVIAGQTYYLAAYPNGTGSRTLSYGVASLQFSSPMVRNGLLAPGVVEFAIRAAPADVETVEYYRGTNLIGVAAPPFTLKWTNVLTGPLVITAVGRTASGVSYQSEIIGLNITAANDDFANATVLPAELRFLETYASAFYAAHGVNETGPGVWWRWTPTASGYCVIEPLNVGVGLLVRKGEERVAEDFNRAVSFVAQAGATYDILTTHTVEPENGFRWTIQNSPLKMSNGTGAHGSVTQLRPTFLSDPVDVARVEYVIDNETVASAEGPDFVGQWTPTAPGIYSVRLKVILTDGATLDGSVGSYQIAPGNDNFSNALALAGELTDQTISLDQRNATTEAGEPFPTSTRTVWWKWTPVVSARARVQIESYGGNITYLVGVGTNLSGLTILAANDYTGRGLIFDAQAGQTYYIEIGGEFNGPVVWNLRQETLAMRLLSAPKPPIRLGITNANPADIFERVDFYSDGAHAGTALAPAFEFSLNQLGNRSLEVVGTNQHGQVRRSFPIDVVIVPANDNFAEAAEIPGSSTNFAGTSTFQNSTPESGEPYHDGSSSLWWKWTPSMSGLVTIRGELQNSNLDGLVAVGDSLTNLTEVARVQHPGRSMEFRAEAGTTYYIMFRAHAWAGVIDWTLEQETFELVVPMHRTPIDLRVVNTNPNEQFESAVILMNEAPLTNVQGPDWTFTWAGAAPGKYTFSAVTTNSAGEKRTTRSIDYWVGPTYDYFIDAPEIAPGVTMTANTGGSSFELGESLWYPEAIGSVWFRWVPTNSGSYTVRIQSGGQNIVGRSSFYEGTAIGKLTRLAPNWGPDSLTANVVAGRVYYLVVTTTERADEPFSFTLHPQPANDGIENAVVLEGSAPSFVGSTISAGWETAEPSFFYPWSRPGFGSIWYEWTASETGNAQLTIDQAPASVGLMAVVGNNWTNSVLHFGYNEIGAAASAVSMRVVKGTTYKFGLYGAPGEVRGRITVTPVAAPANDYKRDAILLAGSDVRVEADLANSTLEPGERSGMGGSAYFGGTIWYRWIAPGAGELKYWLDNETPFYTPGIHVLAVQNPTEQHKAIIVTAGQEVYLQVSHAPNQPQVVALNLKFSPRLEVPNDSMASATPIAATPYSYQGNMLWATREPGEPMGLSTNGGPHTLWWSFKAVEEGVFSASVLSGWQPKLVVYKGSEMSSLQYVTESSGEDIFVKVQAGEELRIQLQTVGDGGYPGEFTLRANWEVGPKNDNFADRVSLQGEVNTVRTWFLSPTLEPGEPVVSSAVTGSLWWSFTPPSDGRLQFQGFPGPIAIYTGDSVDRLTTVMTNGAPYTGLYLIKAAKGQTFHIQVFTHKEHSVERTQFNMAFFPFVAATNDNFADAAPLDGSAKSNYGATRELGEPLHAPAGTNKSLWWKFGAGYNLSGGSIRISQSTISNVTIAVYQGSTVDTLRLVRKGPDRIFFDAWAGETYYVAVETPESEMGDIGIYYAGGAPISASHPIPGNLVRNGSFENTAQPIWAFTESGGRIGEGAPDGLNYVSTYSGEFYQDIVTVPGENYRLRMVFSPDAPNKEVLEIAFGNDVVKRLSAPQGGWQAAEAIVTATTNLSRLKFRGLPPGGSLDQVSLVPLNDPPAMVTQPVSLTVFAGSPVLFHAGISGADPMKRQWYFNGEPIVGATDFSFNIPAAVAVDAGTYYIVATNAYGRVESDHVTLTVEGSSELQIVLQPQSDVIFANQYYALQTAAIGDPPLSYQWSRGGVEIAGATNSSLVFSAFTAGNEGSYTVRVSNRSESVTSLPAVVKLSSSSQQGGGMIWFSNSSHGFPPDVFAPVFDTDGVTRLNGPDFVVQLYAGNSVETMRPVSDAVPFGTIALGTWQGRTVVLPNVVPGAQAFVQVRAWQRSAGASYESARALGGKFGRSEVMTIVAMDRLNPPMIPEGTPLPMQSFKLQAGLPNFVTGSLTLSETQADGTMVWQLFGAAGFRYLIERQVNAGRWEPLTVVTITTGTATFTDLPAATAQMQIYRARMID